MVACLGSGTCFAFYKGMDTTIARTIEKLLIDQGKDALDQLTQNLLQAKPLAGALEVECDTLFSKNPEHSFQNEATDHPESHRLGDNPESHVLREKHQGKLYERLLVAGHEMSHSPDEKALKELDYLEGELKMLQHEQRQSHPLEQHPVNVLLAMQEETNNEFEWDCSDEQESDEENSGQGFFEDQDENENQSDDELNEALPASNPVSSFLKFGG